MLCSLLSSAHERDFFSPRMDTNKAKKHEFFLIVRADTIKASADGIRLSADAIKIFSKGFFSPRKGTNKAKKHEIYIF